MQPLISVIIPVYNHAKELSESLASLAKQTYKETEIIIVDDGSNIPVTTSVGTLIRQEHAGAPTARNTGFNASKGEYVIFWDADVIAEPEMLQKLFLRLQDTPHASFAYCHFIYGDKKFESEPFSLTALKNKNFIHSTSLIKRDAHPLWDESLARFQDWDLWLTQTTQGKAGILVPEFLFRIIPRKHGISEWLPKLAYKKPWSWVPGIHGKVKAYRDAERRVKEKHHLL